MISPAFWITTVSPTRMSLRAISSALCSVARFTVVPASRTGLEVGDRRELARLADLNADVQDLGDRLLGLVLERDRPPRALAARPQPLALARSSTLITRPSVWKSSVFRLCSHSWAWAITSSIES